MTLSLLQWWLSTMNRRLMIGPSLRLLADFELRFWDCQDSLRIRRPLLEMTLKCFIARPRIRRDYSSGQPRILFGVPWTGERVITRIDISYRYGRDLVRGGIIRMNTTIPFAEATGSEEPAAREPRRTRRWRDRVGST